MTVEVVVVGSANADVVVRVERRPGPGETVLGSDTVLAAGGKGANAAVAAALQEARVALLGAVGDDQHGELLRESMSGAGVQLDLVRTTDRPTGAAYITVTPDGENTIVVSPGANSAVDVDQVEAAKDVIAGAKVLLASLEVPLPAIERAVALANEAGTRAVLNLSPVAKLSRQTLAALDPLVVNEHEAQWLMDGATDLTKLLDLGPKSAVVTLGSRGALVIEKHGTTEVESPRVTAVDTTGAGDAFVGALITQLAAGDDLAAAARRAVRVAAVSVTRPGAQASYPTRGEVDSARGMV
ncbi:ribokinase [Kutzneria kofuensis]|uniref:Ribokinase n=1 Tax=Kutzneria kofuensis TaxID=103725 RepID=A0A7W9KHH3_9PSEU|nr:ribokinase [Kutzneria kofuensis]MBB5892678.1 ribokinase [Kutzneria kofuensis]